MKSIIKILIACMAVILVMTGCEYDTDSVVYDPNFTYPVPPVITRLEPDIIAPPGANTITVLGTDFGADKANNLVFFDQFQPEVIEATSTSITVRRPNIVSDSVIVKVVAFNSYSVVRYGPYKIESVLSDVGNFIDLKIQSALLFDKDGNLYVFQKTPRTIWKITPEGDKSEIFVPSKIVTDVKVGPNGNLLMFAKAMKIQQLNLATMEETVWKEAPGKINFGDFDENGNFYGGGERSDLSIIAANGSMSLAGLYSKFIFRCVRVFDGYVYIMADNTRPDDANGNPALGIWRQPILDANGRLGEKELVLDWAAAGDYASSNPTFLTFGQDGMMYVTTDNTNPIFMLDIHTGKQDILYKDILVPPYGYMVWGPTDLYVVQGEEMDKVVKVGMNTPGAPYYGLSLSP